MGGFSRKFIMHFILFIFLWVIILFSFSFGFSIYFDFLLKDTFFLIGLVVLILGLLPFSSGSSMGLSFKELGKLNSQYYASLNLESIRVEKSFIKSGIKDSFKLYLNQFVIILSGLMCMIISYLFL